MKKKPTLRGLRKDEHKAIKEYETAAQTHKPNESQVLRHIKGEEKHHAKELTQLIRKRGSRNIKRSGL